MYPHFDIEPFEGKLEDVSIYFHKLEFHLFNEVVDVTNKNEMRFTAYSNVFANVETHNYVEGRDIVGDIILNLRNQGGDFSLCLLLSANIGAHSSIDNSGRSVFCKVIQYIFDWVTEYVKENNIIDANGKPFIVPGFLYSKDQFTGIDD